MNKNKKTIEQITEHYAKQFKKQSFLNLDLVEATLKRNGHNPKHANDVADKASVLQYLIK